jgi:DNA ligase-1
VFDDETETWQSLCRVLSGFSNEFYIEATKRLKEKVVDAKPYEYDTGEHPALWFDTDEVWEIRGADLQLSPVHRAGAGTVDASRGLGLRFPRFVSIRTDKDLEDATTAGDVVALYQS